MSDTSKYAQYELENELVISEGKGGLPVIKVENDDAQALISIYGGQVLSFKPRSDTDGGSTGNDLLFLSEKAHYEEGKAIKGGIPICWPWFGQNRETLGQQAHGFARNMMWQVVKTSSYNDATNTDAKNTKVTEIVLALEDSEATKKIWPHSFELSLTIKIGKTLSLSLKTTNTDKQVFLLTQALHTYFSVRDITKVRLVGLDQAPYVDTTQEGWPLETQQGDIGFKQEVDRIYMQSADVSLVDENRSISIKPSGSNTTVVWNPWEDISKNSADLDDNAYQQFVCVETANAWDDVIGVFPDKSHELSVEYLIV